MSKFIITGDTDQHGGPEHEPPVLVYDADDIQVFAGGATPIFYDTDAEADTVAARIMRHMEIREVDLTEGGWIVLSTRKHSGVRLP